MSSQLYEYVADINGIALPMYTFDIIKFGKSDINQKLHEALKVLSKTNKYIARNTQIKSYNWISNDIAQQCHARFIKELSPVKDKFDVEVKTQWTDNDIIIVGRIDWIDRINNIIYEIKCTSILTDEHKLQLLMYAFMQLCDHKTYRYILYDILTNESYELTGHTLDNLMIIYKKIRDSKRN
jgi:hypothetical protein